MTRGSTTREATTMGAEEQLALTASEAMKSISQGNDTAVAPRSAPDVGRALARGWRRPGLALPPVALAQRARDQMKPCLKISPHSRCGSRRRPRCCSTPCGATDWQ
jgi:hypothetical protein